ncbi:MAG TPA: fibronectin type III domain-containing protein, partial [Mycobacterium sp.]|nr:fibronectin type III domain-containing protein [Mycobacterium sp.]
MTTWTTGPGTGWTNRVITSPDGDIAEDRIVSTAGSYSATASLGGAGAWVMQMVAFKGLPTTPPAPPTAPTSLAATAASSSQINLSWTNTSTTQTGVKIERSTDNVTFTQIAVAGATAVSFSDGGLTASTTYSYRARATNAAGDSAYSNTASATTQAPPPPPTAPTNLAAAAASSTQINLSWTNGSTNQTGVKIERSTDNVTFAQITVAGATAVSYSDAGLSASTNYFYRARATNAAGDSPYSNTASAATPAPPPTGQWSAVLSWPLVAVHMTMLPNGKVLAWDDHLDNQGADVFDPATNSLNAVPFFTADLFCSGHSLLSDGRVFDAGGHSGTAHVGIANATAFDPATQVWSSLASMPVARWYPTVTALPDGRMLVTAGETNCDGCNALIPDIYDPAANSWSQLSSASQNLPYYPHMFVLPDGRVLAASSNRDAMASVVLNVALQSWAVVDPSVLDGGSAATYAPGKIVKSGLGRDPDLPGAPSVATTYVIDMTQPSPAWRQTASMAFPRTEHNLTLLP